MELDRKTSIELTLESFLRSSADEKYRKFLKSLNIGELEAYFYIEAQRSNIMIQHLTLLNGKKLSISDLMEAANQEYLPKGKSFKEGLNKIISFWNLFGNSNVTDIIIKQSIIEKYNEYLDVLSDEEEDFFLNC